MHWLRNHLLPVRSVFETARGVRLTPGTIHAVRARREVGSYSTQPVVSRIARIVEMPGAGWIVSANGAVPAHVGRIEA